MPAGVQTNRIPTQGLKRGHRFDRDAGQRGPNKQNPDSGIETRNIHSIWTPQPRPNKQNPDSGIETSTSAEQALTRTEVQTNRIPTQGLKPGDYIAPELGLGGPNKQNPDSGIETYASCACWRCVSSPNKQNPDSGIETVNLSAANQGQLPSKQTESRLRD